MYLTVNKHLLSENTALVLPVSRVLLKYLEFFLTV
jgi:hypothetical protein